MGPGPRSSVLIARSSLPGPRYCPICAGELVWRQPPSEDRPRWVCGSCEYIFYQNPKVVAATIPTLAGRAVLLRRGIEPRRGAWTFPGGFMELGETVEEAAIRETKEETGLDVALDGLINLYSRPEVGIVVAVFHARVIGGERRLSVETLELADYLPTDIPWPELAFQSTHWALRDWARKIGKLTD